MKVRKAARLVLIIVLILTLLYIVDKLTKADKKVYIYKTYVVSTGETLWDISIKMCPNMDPRKAVFLIREKSEISPLIYPGQEIQIPILEEGKR